MVIHLLGIQGLAYRDHRDGGPITDFECNPNNNEGNLRALLRLLTVRGDTKITSYLEKCKRKELYIGWKTQNNFIDVIGNYIQTKVLEEIKKYKYFSLLADETSDISGSEQLSVVLRYVVRDFDGKPITKKTFLGFHVATDVTGMGLNKQLLNLIKDWGLDPFMMRGQGYDGAAAMSGQFCGVQAYCSKAIPEGNIRTLLRTCTQPGDKFCK